MCFLLAASGLSNILSLPKSERFPTTSLAPRPGRSLTQTEFEDEARSAKRLSRGENEAEQKSAQGAPSERKLLLVTSNEANDSNYAMRTQRMFFNQFKTLWPRW